MLPCSEERLFSAARFNQTEQLLNAKAQGHEIFMKVNVVTVGAVNTTSEITACRSLEFCAAFMCCY